VIGARRSVTVTGLRGVVGKAIRITCREELGTGILKIRCPVG